MSDIGTLLGPGTGFDTGSGLSALGGLADILGGVAARNQAERNADLAEDLGRLSAEDIRREGIRLEGAQVAAATSVSGSALDIILADAVETEVEALRAKFGFDAQAAVSRSQGRAALLSSIITGTGRILGGIQRSRNVAPRQRTPLGDPTVAATDGPFDNPFFRARRVFVRDLAHGREQIR